MNGIVYPWRLARDLNHMSQLDVSRPSGVDQSFYSKIERRLITASPDVAAQLWAVLGARWRDAAAVQEAVRDPNQCPIDVALCYDLADQFAKDHPGWANNLSQYWIDPQHRTFVPALTPDLQATLIWWLGAWSWALHGLPVRIPGEWEDFEPWAQKIIDEARPMPRKSEADEWPAQAWERLDRESKAAVRLIIERLAAR